MAMRRIKAVYEDGVLKPLGPLDLAENEHVLVTVISDRDMLLYDLDREFLENLGNGLHVSEPAITLQEARGILSKVHGNLSDDVSESRGKH